MLVSKIWLLAIELLKVAHVHACTIDNCNPNTGKSLCMSLQCSVLSLCVCVFVCVVCVCARVCVHVYVRVWRVFMLVVPK